MKKWGLIILSFLASGIQGLITYLIVKNEVVDKLKEVKEADDIKELLA